VLDEDSVPQEADDQHINEENKREYDNPLEKVGKAREIYEILNHL
jgi:hypothetical protein